MKLYAIIGGYLYNDISGICSEDFINEVMNDVNEESNAVKFVEITDSEWEGYEEWVSDRTLPLYRDILSRPKLQARRVTGWRIE